jgi:diguanylate cyclase
LKFARSSNRRIKAQPTRLSAWFGSAPMAAKLSLLGGIAVAFIVFILSVALGVSQYWLAKTEFTGNLQQQANLAAETIQAAVVFEDRAVMREQLEPLFANPDIRSVEVSRQNVRLLIVNRDESDASASAAWGVAWLKPLGFEGAVLKIVTVPVVADGKFIGQVVVKASFASTLRVLLLGYAVLLAASLLAICLSIWMMRRLAVFLTTPLVHLKDVMLDVQKNRAYELRADIETHDEVGALARVFNAMLEQVQATDVVLRRELEVRKKAESRFQHLAMHDALTGLPNRANFMVQLESAIMERRRTGRGYALLFIDLDNFKYINDTYGHAVGDDVLRQVGTRLSQNLRGVDVIARLGGDEFSVLLTDVDRAGVAIDLSEKIARSLEYPMQLGSFAAYVGCSIGVRVLDDALSDVDSLLSQADVAMYSAKALGKGQVALFEQKMELIARGQATVAQQLREALDKKLLTVHYQPQFTVDGQHLRGFEALVRWPGGSGPADFIPVAEESGLIFSLGDYIIEAVLDTLQSWSLQGLPAVRMAINVSAKQLHMESFSASLMRQIESRGINPRNVEIELTETAFLQDLDRAIETLTKLVEQGISVAIDDFGTGYSALTYLRMLPAASIKLDRSFIRGLAASERDRQLVKAVIDMSRALSMEVVAEGVETAQELEQLSRMGCHRVQGYLLGRPAPIDVHIERMKAELAGQVALV